MKRIHYSLLEGRAGYYAALLVLGAIIGAGLLAFLYMEHHGHIVTGMTNQIVWGMPHVFAVFLIVAASGVLNVASIGSVFDKKAYKPLSRLSAVMAVAVLAGGLMILVLDLGRPDRLIVAMTYYNFKSIFAWNMILYNGFFAVVLLYLFVQMSRSFAVQRYKKHAGMAAFLWRLILTTGTGSIFGWLVARQGYDLAVFAPMFIAMSFSFGLAIFLLLMMVLYRSVGRPLGHGLVNRLGRLLGVFVAVAAYFVAVAHLTNLYAAEHQAYERFVLFGGNLYTWLLWGGFGLIGTVLPLALLFSNAARRSFAPVALASALVIAGGLVLMYVIIIGGQAFPLVMFPGKEVSSSFVDGVINGYTPSLPEIALGLAGAALAVAITVSAAKVLPILPRSLADDDVDPHLAREAEVVALKKAA